jgi:hypothetical protein
MVALRRYLVLSSTLGFNLVVRAVRWHASNLGSILGKKNLYSSWCILWVLWPFVWMDMCARSTLIFFFFDRVQCGAAEPSRTRRKSRERTALTAERARVTSTSTGSEVACPSAPPVRPPSASCRHANALRTASERLARKWVAGAALMVRPLLLPVSTPFLSIV